MKFYKIIIVAASVFALVACSTSKEISYFQDLRPGESELMLAVPMEIKIQPFIDHTAFYKGGRFVIIIFAAAY